MMFGLKRLHFIREEDEFLRPAQCPVDPAQTMRKHCEQGNRGPDLLLTSGSFPQELAGQHEHDGRPVRTGTPSRSCVLSSVLLDTVWRTFVTTCDTSCTVSATNVLLAVFHCLD